VDAYLRKYPGLLFGGMAAAGMIKVSALLWQEKLSAWPLMHVLVVPVALAGLALGLGAGRDRIVSRSAAQRLAPVGGLVLLIVPLAGLFSGLEAAVLAGTVAGPLGLALLGLQLGHPETRVGAVLRGDPGSSGEYVEVE